MDSLQLIPIGTFSSMTQLSAKALRLYAENGMLLPARVDDQTGYRYYTHAQVATARLIRTLRDMDMPLTLVAQCVQRPERVEAVAIAHMRALENAQIQRQRAHRHLTGLIRPASDAAQSVVSTVHIAPGVVVLQPFLASATSLLDAATRTLKELSAQVMPALLDASRCTVPLPLPLSSSDEIALELYVPVASGELPAQTPLATRHEPALQCACVNVSSTASGPDFVAATDALFDWFDHHGKTLRGAPLLLIGHGALQLAWPITYPVA